MNKLYYRLLIFFGALSLITLFTSCSSSLMKASPLYTGQIITGKSSSGQIVRWDDPEAVKIEKIFASDIKTKMDDDRIYIWPIFYKNFLMYSFLWPVAEINDVGWEIRPFLSVDNYKKDYRVLTGGWNNKNSSSYLLPLYIKNKNEFYSLPYSYFKHGSNYIDNYMLLGGYSSKTNSSYFAPLYFYDGVKSMLYTPLFAFSKQYGYIFPIYFYKKTSSTHKYHFLYPLWKTRYDNINNEFSCTKAQFFPFFYYRKNKKNSYSNYMILGGNGVTDIDGKLYSSSHILPFYYYNYKSVGHRVINCKQGAINSDSKNKTTIRKNSYYFPSIFMTEYENREYDSLALFPFFFKGYDKRGTNDSDWLHCFPLYFYKRDKENVYNNYGILTGTRDETIMDKKYPSSYILPFYNYDYDEIKNRFKNPKYKDQVFKYNERPEDYFVDNKTISKSTYILPSFFSERYFNDQYNSSTIFPFYFRGYDKRYSKDKEWHSIFPFFFYSRSENDIAKNYLCLVGTSKKTIIEKEYKSSYILPFYYYGYSKDKSFIVRECYKDKKLKFHERPDDYYETKVSVRQNTFIFPSIFLEKNIEKEELKFFLFPLLSHNKNKQFERTKAIFALYNRTKSLTNNDLTTQLLYFLYYYKRDQSGTSKYIFPSYYSYGNSQKTHKTTHIFPFYYAKKSKNIDSLGFFFWLYSSKSYLKQKKSETQAVWYLYYNIHIDANKEKSELEYESSRIFWKAYHRETRGDATNIDIFPFISYSKNINRSKISFAYRFFSVESTKNKTKVHLFYIPIWW